MNAPDLQARLQRLDGYLQQDSGNAALRLDAFETARQLRDWTRADAYARQALHRHPDALWRLRAGEVALAQLQWDEAARWFDAVRQDPDAGEDVRRAAEHQLAEVMLHTSRPDLGIALLGDWIENAGAAIVPATQVLWLRLLHRVERLEDAVDAARQWEGVSRLSSAAAGVASLAALDLDRLDLAERWAGVALQSGHRQFEALITAASVALGRTDAAAATALLSEALQRNPRDGRSWSMLGFADLLAGQFELAVEHFETAVRYMPQHVGTWHGLGWAWVFRQDLQRARTTFEHAVSLDRNFSEGHGGLAAVLALSGEKAAARAAMETARRLDRGSMAVRYAEAVLAGDHRNVEHLRQLAARALAGRGSMADEMSRRLARVREAGRE